MWIQLGSNLFRRLDDGDGEAQTEPAADPVGREATVDPVPGPVRSAVRRAYVKRSTP